ncbi:DUF294 nucleotidyltransferase-like domain-containing protein [Desertibacillus haloalkaliphilus]|uniref:DUF294 nucleotidyltransferase-like domain-containing protein n=1 Tax=Desertibacillus haloalkaliphilus TaxID=1328930 RepID=UPI001C2746F1|nr:DUF294 nucleotidyltransferase-like domain-containing protein [Desertibacillus haloalkaliphilus]MBU8905912.1 CBS domain-containing protein [Desertibacillus haloalkaliphilus]
MRYQENNELYEQIKRHQLFTGVSDSEFEQLIAQCTLKHYAKAEKVLYSKTPREGLLLILDGMAEVYVDGEYDYQSQEVLEVLQCGDIIGFSSLADFLGEKSDHIAEYTVEVRAIEESSCLQIPYSVVDARWDDEAVRDFVLRQVSVRLRDVYGSLAEQVKLANQWGESDPFIRRIQDVMKEPCVSVHTGESVQAVAKKMVEHSSSSVVVEDDDLQLVGIITEKDVVQRVVATLGSPQQNAASIMTTRPFTIERDAYYYEAMSSFLMNGIKHLPVVEQGRAVGMVTLSGLLQKKNRGTLQILQKIEESSLANISAIKNAIYDVLSNLIHDEIPTINTLEIITKLYDRLVRHCVDLAVDSLRQQGKGEPPVPFCWFQMGSGGRGEQFLLTDQDHFLVYADPSEEEEKQVAAYFRLLGKEIVDHLEQAGYKRCEGKMMASEENWRGSVMTWEQRLRTWGLRATNDNVLLGNNFLSFRFLYGDDVLHDQFVKMVKEQFTTSKIFLYRMAEQEKAHPVPTLDHPIRALFRLKRDSIDIKKHALFPLHHCLQLMAAHKGVLEGTPLKRIDRLVNRNVFTEEFADDLRFAYEIVLKLRVDQAWNRYLRDEEGTSVIKFTHIRSRDKEELMIALKTIRSLQNQTLGAFGLL